MTNKPNESGQERIQRLIAESEALGVDENAMATMNKAFNRDFAKDKVWCQRQIVNEYVKALSGQGQKVTGGELNIGALEKACEVFNDQNSHITFPWSEQSTEIRNHIRRRLTAGIKAYLSAPPAQAGAGR